MPSEADKRRLQFASIDEMVQDMDVLLSRGYEQKGNWNLAQVGGHVTEWMRYPMDGFPPAPLPIKALLWLMGKTVGPGMKKKILAGGFKTGMMTDPKTLPSPGDKTDEEAARLLRETAIRLSEHEGPLHPSPLFGPMDREMALRVSLMHAAHHLAFLHPKLLQR